MLGTMLVKPILFTWPLVVLVLFARLPKSRALLIAVIGGQMFLPEIQMAGVCDEAPDANGFVMGIVKMTKPNAIAFGALLAAIIFDLKRLLTFRPRWFDLPILCFCVIPMISNLNNGVTPYDSFSALRDKTLMWGVPYFLGRVYFNTLERFRELAIAIVIAGAIYAPLCWYESIMFPRLHENLYGFFPGARNEAIRAGGYRPVMFMSHGIMLGLWMVATAVVAFWLWWTGAVDELRIWPLRRPLSMKVVSLTLIFTAVWARSTGAIGLGAACVLGTLQVRLVKFPLILAGLLAVSPIFLYARISGWDGESFIQLLKDNGMPDERLGSLKYRFRMENRLLLNYAKKPAFGYGDSSRDANGRAIWRQAPMLDRDDGPDAVADAMWVITLAQFGHFGLIAMWAVLMLPAVRFLLVHPAREWFHPAPAPALSAVLVLILFMNDNLFNAFYNPIFLLTAGGLSSLTGVRLPRPAPVEEEAPTEVPPDSPPPAPRPAPRPGVLIRNRRFR